MFEHLVCIRVTAWTNLKILLPGQLKMLKKNGEVLVLTDMFSGSPFNAAVSLMQHYTFFHITGINLPVLLEILMSRETSGAAELCEDILSRAKDTIINVNKYFGVNI
jgi:PTS system mannose-specific IIA component